MFVRIAHSPALASDRIRRVGVVSTSARRTAGAGLLLLAACVSPPPKDHPRETGLPAPAATVADASYDWRPLVVAPFGTRLVDSPIRLHEVLLFRDQSLGVAEIESRDCYAVDGTPPAFVGVVPDEYLICFEHDRLARIDASVRIAADTAARNFERACALWLGNAKPPPPADAACEGRDGDVDFSGRLEVVPGELTAKIIMTLSDAAERDAERAPPDDPGAASSAAP
jgi:hypothetical protein